jgi:Family of unknown function (DUF6502)
VNLDSQESAARGAFLDSLESTMRPLMPLVLHYGVEAADVGEVFKTIYLETLAERLIELGRPATIPRLALMAGLNRSEVEALLTRRAERRERRSHGTAKMTELSQVLSTWHDDPRFSTPYGAPVDLSLQPERNFKTFSDLVDAAIPGSEANLVLDELAAAGCVEIHVNKFVRCVSRVFVPVGMDVTRVVHMGRMLGAYSDNLAHNLMRNPEDARFYDVAVVTESTVSTAFRDEMDAYLRTHMQKNLEELDRWVVSKESDFQDPAGARYGVCTFSFRERDFGAAVVEPTRTEKAN